jgi:hypothetical protein
MDVIRRFANRKCSRHLEHLALTIDAMLSQPDTRNAVRSLFGLSALEHDYDFVSTIEVSVQPRCRRESTVYLAARPCLDLGKIRTGILQSEAMCSTTSA